MRKINLLVAAMLTLSLPSVINAQQSQTQIQSQATGAPQSFKYQAVARNTNGDAIANQPVSFRISIIEGSAEGTVVYSETQKSTTNQFGLANLSIGSGVVVSGVFNSIKWESGNYFIKIEFDPKGGDNFTIMGTSQMLSVPYSLYAEHAKIADNVTSFPVKAALQGTNVQAPLDNPETGMLVYNTGSAGEAPYNVIPGYYYNRGTPAQPDWVLLMSSANEDAKSVKRLLALGTNTSYGGLAQDGLTGGGIGSGVGSLGTGSNNSAFGDSAMNSAMTGDNNTGEGYFILRHLTSGADNTAIGYNALIGTTSGYENTAMGSLALSSSSGGGFIQNTAVGYAALQNNTTNSETALGFEAMNSNTSGAYNTAVGQYSLYTNQTSDYNTAVGFHSLYSNTAAVNSALGYYALSSNTSGTGNNAFGVQALYNNVSASYNTADGFDALYTQSYNPGSSWNSCNVAVGSKALYSNQPNASTNGIANTAVGNTALYKNTTGFMNTAVGDSTLYVITTGDSNTAIGYNANPTNGTFNNTISVGYGVSVNASDKAVIGNNNMTVIGGKVGWSTLSDGRYKTDVNNYNVGLSFILNLRPVSYIYTVGDNHEVYDGFIAQEVEKTLNTLGVQFSGLCKPTNPQDNYSIRYGDFVVPLVNAVKELDAKNQTLQAENNQLKEKETKLENELSELQTTVNSLVKAQASH